MKKVLLVLSLVSVTLGACSSLHRETASSLEQKEGYRPVPSDIHR